MLFILTISEGFFLLQDRFPEEVRPYSSPHNGTKTILSDIRSHTHSNPPASFPGLVEFFLLLLLPLWCLVDFRNLENTVSLLLALLTALFLVRFLKLPVPFGFHLLKPFMVHTFRHSFFWNISFGLPFFMVLR